MQYRQSRFGSIPTVVKNLLIINIIVFIATTILESSGIDLVAMLALHNPSSSLFSPIQVITHMFMHGSLSHLFFNMFALWMFGAVLERVWGEKRFLIYYLATGVGAALLHTLVNYIEISTVERSVAAFINTPTPEAFGYLIRTEVGNPTVWLSELIESWHNDPNSSAYTQQAISVANSIASSKVDIPTVGASGAVFGLLMAYGMLFPNNIIQLLFPPIPIKAKYFVLGYGLIELFSGLSRADSNVAHFAHLGGMLFGYLLIKHWNKSSNNFY